MERLSVSDAVRRVEGAKQKRMSLMSIKGALCAFVALWSVVGTLSVMARPLDRSNEGYVAVGYESDDLEERLRWSSGPVSVRVTSEVKRRIRQYIEVERETAEILARKERFFPIFEMYLKKYEMPEALKYVAVIESSLNPEARSKSGAVGLWQLMKRTARMLGLHISHRVDMRRDPHQSTDAALRYLKSLYEEFGDWTLALAAYNSGPARVRRAIRRAGSRDYWVIRRYLPRETRSYVPKFIAASYVFSHHQYYGIEPMPLEEEYWNTATIVVYEHLTFEEIAQRSGVRLEVIRELNPPYLHGEIPASKKGHPLTLPVKGMWKFIGLMDEDVVFADTLSERVMKRFAESMRSYKPITFLESYRIASLRKDVDGSLMLTAFIQTNRRKRYWRIVQMDSRRRNSFPSPMEDYTLYREVGLE